MEPGERPSEISVLRGMVAGIIRTFHASCIWAGVQVQEQPTNTCDSKGSLWLKLPVLDCTANEPYAVHSIHPLPMHSLVIDF